MSVFSEEFYGLLNRFEMQYSHLRLDRENKDLWTKSIIYQDGHTNQLFLAYRRGFSYGVSIANSE